MSPAQGREKRMQLVSNKIARKSAPVTTGIKKCWPPRPRPRAACDFNMEISNFSKKMTLKRKSLRMNTEDIENKLVMWAIEFRRIHKPYDDMRKKEAER